MLIRYLVLTEVDMQLLTKKQTAAVVGLHPESVMRLTREKRFPSPIKTGDAVNCGVRFDQAEVDAWIEARKQARGA
jgi:predicted DNA-binding transcriptional regulator AlpA